MHRTIFIRLLALLLTFSLVSEFTAYLHYGDMISIEIDADGEEEESKEDKLKDHFDSILTAGSTEEMAKELNAIHLTSRWNCPTIDSATPPPELA